jgi:hypothetical protein
MKTILLALTALLPCLPLPARAEKPETSEKAGKNEKEDDDETSAKTTAVIAAKLAKLPAPAADALKKAAGSATITAVDTEEDKGVSTYEVDLKEKGKPDREVTVSAEGKILIMESAIPLKEVPAAAKKAIEDGAKGARIVRVNQMVRGDPTSYEALYELKGEKTEVEYLADGTLKPD